MKVKDRKKVTRMRGSHTHGRGAKKKARGSGHRGGIGKAGSGKRGDQKKTLIIKKYGSKYFGKDKALRSGKKRKVKSISLDKIKNNIDYFIKRGIVKGSEGVYELDLRTYKIIGNSDVSMKLKINAFAASEGAQKAVKKSGGEIILKSSKDNEKENTKDSLKDSKEDEI